MLLLRFLNQIQILFYLFAGQEDRVIVSCDDVDQVLGPDAAHVRDQQRTETRIEFSLLVKH